MSLCFSLVSPFNLTFFWWTRRWYRPFHAGSADWFFLSGATWLNKFVVWEVAFLSTLSAIKQKMRTGFLQPAVSKEFTLGVLDLRWQNCTSKAKKENYFFSSKCTTLTRHSQKSLQTTMQHRMAAEIDIALFEWQQEGAIPKLQAKHLCVEKVLWTAGQTSCAKIASQNCWWNILSWQGAISKLQVKNLQPRSEAVLL